MDAGHPGFMFIDNEPTAVAPIRHRHSKVPTVTALFWVIKVLTTGFGEAASDAAMRTFGMVAAGVAAIVLVAALAVQFRSRRLRPPIYWFAVAMVAVFGTMAADIPASLGTPLWATSVTYLALVAVVFALWWRAEGTLSFSSIGTRRREGFYWAAVLSTFALGTAVGDLTADAWGWGNLASGLVFCALIAVPAVAVRSVGLNAVAGFWIAYVLTRPLGASFADWTSLPQSHGGLGLGAPLAAALWAVPLIVIVCLQAVAAGRHARSRDLGTDSPSVSRRVLRLVRAQGGGEDAVQRPVGQHPHQA